MAELAVVLAALSLVVSLAAAWYSRSSSIATLSMADVERRRSAREEDEAKSARLLMREGADRIQIWNLGSVTAYDVKLAYPGLRFQTLMEDDDAGLQIAPGDMLELMTLIDWDHPRNDHARHHREGGTMGVPRWPLDLAWRDDGGRHLVKRRVTPPGGTKGGD